MSFLGQFSIFLSHSHRFLISSVVCRCGAGDKIKEVPAIIFMPVVPARVGITDW